MPGSLYITGDPDADGLLNGDGTALLIGMLLDQQVPMEWAFAGPATLRGRLGHLDAGRIAAMDVEDVVAVCCRKPAIHRFPASLGRRIHQLCTVLADRYGGRGDAVWADVEDFVAVCCQKPAIHRFPASLGRRIHQLCTVLADCYGGQGEAVWADVADGAALYARLRRLPGYGDEKAKIFVAILAKTQEVAPSGWRDAAGRFGDDVPRSVADITGPESLAAVRAWKQAQKAANRDKQDRPLPPAT